MRDMRPINPRLASSAGFTLIELLVTAAIFILVLAALGGLLVSSTRAYQVNATRSEALQDSEAVLQLMRYEIGLAGYRGVEAATFDRPFTLGVETVEVDHEASSAGDDVTVRYFEDRYLQGGDTGEREVTFRVNGVSNTLERVDRRPGGAGTVTELLVGNVISMQVIDLVSPDRDRFPVGVVAGGGAGPDALAGLNFRVIFADEREWEFMIGLTNPQSYDVR